ncbi:SUN domain-containing protein 3-like [Archocentrus centrarchus]|uniref:SUN domain-containing protein 3-like n=1 Tax=Archocentrus centrarchus TaxID=63155 RepID=UPI0011EA34DC|nr:SUN domain-containing protein 3-like [Archocentrus centrarchus]XP_030609881.1 SUN domain-containing protein 3-like [Archocentrus centrarchus]
MLRRSRRLQENGYYGSDGEPVICYNERTNRVFKKLKGGFHARFDTFPDTYLDVPLDVPSGTRSSETSPANRPWKMLAFILFLCLGLFVTLAFRTEFSTNTVTNVSSGNSEDVWKHLKELQVKELQEEVKKLQEELEERQEKCQEEVKKRHEEVKKRHEEVKKRQQEVKKRHEEVKELREEVKKCREEREECQEELEEKMEFLHPVSDMMPNFALESLGAKIITDMTSESYPPEDKGFSLFGFQVLSPKFPPPVSPRILLQGLTPTTPGRCWAFKGTKGRVCLELPYSMMVSHVTIGHIPQNKSPDGTASSAPRLFQVLGQRTMYDRKIYLGTFRYDIRGPPLQTFEIKGHDKMVVKFLTLWIHKNWGNSYYTSVYSFRVHGKVTDSKALQMLHYL